jgi:hypothetical protein
MAAGEVMSNVGRGAGVDAGHDQGRCWKLQVPECLTPPDSVRHSEQPVRFREPGT